MFKPTPHLLFGLLLVSGCALAMDDAPTDTAPPTESPAATPVSTPGEFSFYLGDFRADDNASDLINPDSDFAFGVAVYFNFAEHVDYGIDLLFAFSDYATPPGLISDPFTVIGDEISVSTLGLAGVLRARYDTDHLRAFAGAGMGLYFSRLAVYASTFGFPGTHEERSNNLGFFYNAGLMLKLSPEHLLGAEYRRLFLEAGFSPVTQADADIGGEFLLLTYTYIFQ